MARKRTATGQAILEEAIKIKRKSPELSLSDAKKEAKKRINEKEAFDKKTEQLKDKLLHGGIGQKLKKKVLVSLVGETIGTKIAELTRTKASENKAADALFAHEGKTKEDKDFKKFDKENYKPEKIPSKEVAEILEKLNAIEKDVKIIKIAKVEAPKIEKVMRPTRNPHYEDAALGLKALGFKKEEIKERLQGASGNSPQELIKYALKPAAQRIPAPEVPSAVKSVKERVEDADKLASSTTNNNSSQAEASNTKKEEADLEAKKEEKESRKKILDELTSIEKKIGTLAKGGLIDLLLVGIGVLIYKYWKPIKALFENVWAKLKPVVEWIWDHLKPAIEFVWDCVKKIFGFMEKIVKALHIDSAVAGLFQQPEAERGEEHLKEMGGTPTSKEEAIKMGLPSWVDPEDPNKYHVVPKDERVGPQNQIKLENGVPKIVPLVKPSDNKVTNLDQASQDNSDMKADAAQPVIEQNVNNDNRIINPPSNNGGGDNSPTFLNVRNMEGSSSSYISEIFNHPARSLEV